MAKTLLSLTTDLENATKACATAQGPKALAKAMAERDLARDALSDFKSKTTKETKTTKEVREDDEPSEEADEEEESDEEEDEEESDDDDKEDDEKDASSSKDDDDDDKDDDDDDDDDDDEEERCEKAVTSAKKSLASVKATKNADAIASAREALDCAKSFASASKKNREKSKAIKNAARSATGKKNSARVIAGLQGLPSATKNLAAEVATMKRERREEKVKAVLSKAFMEGRISPSLRGELATAEGRKRKLGTSSPKALKSFVSELPKKVRSLEEGGAAGKTRAGGSDGDGRDRSYQTSASALDVDADHLTPAEKKILMGAWGGGSFVAKKADGSPGITTKIVSFDEFMAEFQKTKASLKRDSR